MGFLKIEMIISVLFLLATVVDGFTSDIILSTIDSDIASIPQDDFKTVFLGGVVVMFGGVLSAVIVGTALKINNGYGQVIADSYIDGGEEAFLQGLNDEERVEAEELLRQIRGEKETKEKESVPPQQQQEAKKDMFSDY